VQNHLREFVFVLLRTLDCATPRRVGFES